MNAQFLPLIALTGLALGGMPVQSATLISLNDITPGTETVTLVINGDFETGTPAEIPTGWTRGGGGGFYDTVATAGLAAAGFANLPSTGTVGYYTSRITANNTNVAYFQTISGVEPNTEYVFSAYVWNNSKAAVAGGKNLVLDFNDNRPGPPIGDGSTIQEAQMILLPGQANGADGYFIYQTFNTGTTGTAFTFRVFTQPAIYTTAGVPIMVWDNIAITKSADFIAPTLMPEPAAPFEITEIRYDKDASKVTLTWRKTGAAFYTAKYSLDMTDWSADMGDSLTDALDENPGDPDHITVTFDLAASSVQDETELFFRIEEQ